MSSRSQERDGPKSRERVVAVGVKKIHERKRMSKTGNSSMAPSTIVHLVTPRADNSMLEVKVFDVGIRQYVGEDMDSRQPVRHTARLTVANVDEKVLSCRRGIPVQSSLECYSYQRDTHTGR